MASGADEAPGVAVDEDEDAWTPPIHLVADMLRTGAMVVVTRVLEHGRPVVIGASAIQPDGDVVTRLAARCLDEPALGRLHLARVRARLDRLAEVPRLFRRTGALTAGVVLLGVPEVAGNLLALETALAVTASWLAGLGLSGGAAWLVQAALRRVLRTLSGRFGPPCADPDEAADGAAQ